MKSKAKKSDEEIARIRQEQWLRTQELQSAKA